MSAKCCGAHVFRHTTVDVDEGGGQCYLQKKGEVIICNCFVFCAGLFPRNCCRLKSAELHTTLKIKCLSVLTL